MSDEMRDGPSRAAVPETEDSVPAARARDAGKTRQLLLHAARRRFARDGYSATTVRDIATDAGVNVALINRYFSSKEGLFEACLARAGEDLDTVDASGSTLEQTVRSMIRQITDSAGGEQSLQLLLLLRSSGDERADQIRRDTFTSLTERLASTGRPAGKISEEQLLHAQIALSITLGLVLARSSTGLEPLTSATEDTLRGPLSGILTRLLTTTPA
jgi:Transcriptional regulator